MHPIRQARSSLLTLVLAILVCPVASQCAELPRTVLFWLPRESGEVAFVDLKEVRTSPHYVLLKQRLVPTRLREFEQFLGSIGIQVDQDLDWLGWALVPPGRVQAQELMLGIAAGRFEPDRVERFYQEQKLPLDTYRGQTLFPFGEGSSPGGFYFTFVDLGTAVFGTRASLELLLETRFGAHENILRNQDLAAQINEVNGRAAVWVVLNQHYAQLAVKQLLPGVGKFEQFSEVAQRLLSAQLRLELEKELDGWFDMRCAGFLDAQVLSLLVETALEVQGWRLKETDPLLSAVLKKTEVASIGDRMEVRLRAEEKQVRALLESPRPLF